MELIMSKRPSYFQGAALGATVGLGIGLGASGINKYAENTRTEEKLAALAKTPEATEESQKITQEAETRKADFAQTAEGYGAAAGILGGLGITAIRRRRKPFVEQVSNDTASPAKTR
jgi:hypothetical protein